MKLVIIGSGNTATVLGRKIRQAGHEILQVFSRRQEHAACLADELEVSSFTNDWEAIEPGAELYLFALSDSALTSLPALSRTAGPSSFLFSPLSASSEASPPGNRFLVHTAGSVPLETLKGMSSRCGVLYPLQSLRREIRSYPEIPLLTDAGTSEDRALLLGFARSLSPRVEWADDEKRKKLHLAAVIVNNFTNHLFRLAEDYCREERVDFALLHPLIMETAARLDRFSPRDVQTGPASRRDEATIETHVKMLNNYVSTKELYRIFTEQIEAYGAAGITGSAGADGK